MSGIRTLFFNRIAGQIAVLILLSLLAIHVFIIASLYYFSDRLPPPGPPGSENSQFVAVIRMIAVAAPAERAQTLAQAAQALPSLHLAQVAAPPPAASGQQNDNRFGFLAGELGPALKLTALGRGDNGGATLAVTLPDGAVIAATLDPPRLPPMLGGPMAMTVLFIVVSITLLGLWAALALGNPLSAFAQAAEDFSLDGHGAALAERGPEEVRAVARAFNRMRDRIKALVDDRTRLFTAMSHDLRTPITRLRLRSEFITDAELRGQMLRDLDQMKAMTESVLTFLRDGKSREAESAMDIASSLQTIADEFADLGHAVAYEGPDRLTLAARPNELHRAVVNLVDNAVRYGSAVVVRLSTCDSMLLIDVEDDGPGIPEARKTAMLEPFTRGDAARTMDERSGFGLGLAIARATAEAHGGTLSLNDRVPHGLIARIALPNPVVSITPH